jgi:hypothetical protein
MGEGPALVQSPRLAHPPQLRADQERACDDAVLRHGVRASDYAQSLLDLSRHTRLAPGLSLCALTITRCAPVEARVKAILDPQRRREGLTLRWLASLAGGALLITLPVAMLHAIEGPPCAAASWIATAWCWRRARRRRCAFTRSKRWPLMW